VDANDLTLLLIAATAAGWIDAVVGGGGLLLIPAMLIGVPQLPTVTILATNKFTASLGTTSAAITYARRIPVDWKIAGPAAALAMPVAGLGAWLASSVPTSALRPAVLGILVAVALFVTFRPAMGTVTQPSKRTSTRAAVAIALAGGGIALYDGVFGPGTGTFLILTLTTVVGANYLHASAMAKIINVATNFGALIVFAIGGHIHWRLGALMAIGNIAGAQLGARMALRKGSHFVRIVLLAVVCGLVARIGWDLYQS
jgi:uncharacterized membrane protein YfcA